MPNLKNNKNEMLENVSLKRINKGIFLDFKGNKKKNFFKGKITPKENSEPTKEKQMFSLKKNFFKVVCLQNTEHDLK